MESNGKVTALRYKVAYSVKRWHAVSASECEPWYSEEVFYSSNEDSFLHDGAEYLHRVTYLAT